MFLTYGIRGLDKAAVVAPIEGQNHGIIIGIGMQWLLLTKSAA